MGGVLLGIGGGIAAYKAAELARALMERGFGVQVVMTAAAEEFVRPLTFAALTGRKVITEMFATGGATIRSPARLSISVSLRRTKFSWSRRLQRTCSRSSPPDWPEISSPLRTSRSPVP
jgi:hypothetical protein